MVQAKKTHAVADFVERVRNSRIAIAAKFKGINAEQAADLRKRLREQRVQIKVFKNTLVRRALNELGLSEAGAFLEGPIAWAFSEDPLGSAKLLQGYAKEVDKVSLNGGILEGRVVTKAQLETLASLPPRETLLAQLIGTIAMPLRTVLGVLNAPARNLATVLDQIGKQKEQGIAA